MSEKPLDLDGILENHSKGLLLASRKGAVGRRMTLYMHEDVRRLVQEFENECEGLSTSVVFRWILLLGIAALKEGERHAPK